MNKQGFRIVELEGQVRAYKEVIRILTKEIE